MHCKRRNKEIFHRSESCELFGHEIPSNPHVSSRKIFMIILIIVGIGIVDSLLAMPVYFTEKNIYDIVTRHQIMETFQEPPTNEPSVSIATSNSEIMEGTTWSYTEHVSHGDRSYDVKTYFIFTSQTDVVWLFGTPKGNMFPVGFGTYNPSTGNLTFSSSDKLHEKISLYYADNTIIFKFDPSSGRARLYINDDYLSDFYNDGKDFYMTKLGYTLTPKNDLVGTFWKMGDGDETYIVYFKSWNEAILHGESEESCAYVYIDDMVSIKSGDNITDENLIGRFRGGNEMPLCREGIDPYGDVWCGTLRKVK